MITHYQRLLDYIEPDHVHVLSDGRIVASGDKSLAAELEQRGYAASQRGGVTCRVATALNHALQRHSGAEDGLREPDLADRATAPPRMQRFTELGLPARRDEAWRFTDLRPLDAARVRRQRRRGHQRRSRPTGGASPAGRGASHRAGEWLRGTGTEPRSAHCHGAFGLARPPTPSICAPICFEAAFDASDTFGAQPFASLNAAFFADGFVLALEPGVVLQHPVEVLHLGEAPSPQAYHLRSAILAGAGSQASVVETYVGSGAGWTNAVTAIDIGAGATLRHVKVQAEGADGDPSRADPRAPRGRARATKASH